MSFPCYPRIGRPQSFSTFLPRKQSFCPELWERRRVCRSIAPLLRPPGGRWQHSGGEGGAGAYCPHPGHEASAASWLRHCLGLFESSKQCQQELLCGLSPLLLSPVAASCFNTNRAKVHWKKPLEGFPITKRPLLGHPISTSSEIPSWSHASELRGGPPHLGKHSGPRGDLPMHVLLCAHTSPGPTGSKQKTGGENAAKY